jgi:hypothetical protein
MALVLVVILALAIVGLAIWSNVVGADAGDGREVRRP